MLADDIELLHKILNDRIESAEGALDDTARKDRMARAVLDERIHMLTLFKSWLPNHADIAQERDRFSKGKK